MKEIQIRAVAARLMAELCLQCDTNFHFKNVDAFAIFNGTSVEKQEIIKASKYLCEKKYITGNALASDSWENSITATGIDWVEDYLNINHSL